MLNSVKKYIHFFAIFSVTICLLIFIIFDMNKFLKNSMQYRNKHKLEKYSQITNVYTKISKEANDENNSIKEQNSKDKIDEEEEQEVSKLGSVDIYSTNKWRIKIPKLKLDAPIVEGTSQESLRRTVGHFEETDKWKGNVALAAHNRGYKCNFFQEIKKLEIGDVIIYSTEKGEREYQVILNKVIKETDWSYIQDTKDNRITLITCEAEKREYRRCIQAMEIK